MAFNISEFRANSNKIGGFAKPYNYEVVITNPDIENANIQSEDLKFFCEQCTVPGFQYLTDSVFHDGIGYSESRPIGYQINPVVFTFLSDQKSKIYQFFYEWLKQISKFDLQSAAGNPLRSDPFLFQLPETFAKYDMTILQYDTKGAQTREFKLINAYPQTINSFDLNWGNKSEFIRVIVEIQYRRWQTKIIANEGS